jgi:hypothetical protein
VNIRIRTSSVSLLGISEHVLVRRWAGLRRRLNDFCCSLIAQDDFDPLLVLSYRLLAFLIRARIFLLAGRGRGRHAYFRFGGRFGLGRGLNGNARRHSDDDGINRTILTLT